MIESTKCMAFLQLVDFTLRLPAMWWYFYLVAPITVSTMCNSAMVEYLHPLIFIKNAKIVFDKRLIILSKEYHSDAYKC